MVKGNFFISTAIDYTSGKPHIGHLYEKVCTDAIARWNRLRGNKVHFSTGVDTHGLKIQRNAEKKNKTPKKFVEELTKDFKKLCETYNITYDDFISTEDDRHKKIAQELFQKLYDNEQIYLSNYEGLYCVDCETYYMDKDLKDGKCKIHDKKCEKVKEQSYFFKLASYEKDLLEHLNQDFSVLPKKRKNEIINRIKEGLNDLSVSRRNVDWGIKVPFDDNHTIFVWIEALMNYISTLDGIKSKKFKDFWPGVHVIGKDIFWHHTVIWYSILKALKLPLPKTVLVHGFVNISGEKMSKSKGITIDPLVLNKKYGADGVRYFLLREMPFGDDGDFSENSLKNRINNELANDLGNLLSRTISMILKYFDGKAPNGKKDENIVNQLNETFKKSDKLMDNFEIDKTLAEVWSFINYCNKYVNDQKPWEKEKKEDIIYNLYESLKCISILLSPFIPETSEKIACQLGLKKCGSFKELKFDNVKAKVVKGEMLFHKLE